MKRQAKWFSVLLCAAIVCLFCAPAHADGTGIAVGGDQAIQQLNDVGIVNLVLGTPVKLTEAQIEQYRQSSFQGGISLDAALSISLGEQGFEIVSIAAERSTAVEWEDGAERETVAPGEETDGGAVVQRGFSDVVVAAIGLGSGFSEPLPGSVDVEYTYVLENMTSTPASNLYMEIWVDSMSAGTFYIGPLPAWSRLLGSFYLGIDQPNSQHTFRLRLNNGSQNTRTFSYGTGTGCDLAVQNVRLDAAQPVAVPATLRFYADILNLGPSNCNGGKFSIEVDQTTIGSPRNFNLDAGYMVPVYFDLDAQEGTAVGSGMTIGVRAEHRNDPDTRNNYSHMYVSTKSTPHWGGRWASANGLNVKVEYGEFNSAGYDNATIDRYINLWNNISGSVSLNILPTGSLAIPQITVVSESIPRLPKPQGIAYVYNSGEEIEDVYGDTRYYTSAKVIYEITELPYGPIGKVIPHEFGHALGLAHIFESPATIMYPYSDVMTVTYPTAAIDYVNLRARYGP